MRLILSEGAAGFELVDDTTGAVVYRTGFSNQHKPFLVLVSGMVCLYLDAGEWVGLEIVDLNFQHVRDVVLDGAMLRNFRLACRGLGLVAQVRYLSSLDL